MSSIKAVTPFASTLCLPRDAQTWLDHSESAHLPTFSILARRRLNHSSLAIISLTCTFRCRVFIIFKFSDVTHVECHHSAFSALPYHHTHTPINTLSSSTAINLPPLHPFQWVLQQSLVPRIIFLQCTLPLSPTAWVRRSPNKVRSATPHAPPSNISFYSVLLQALLELFFAYVSMRQLPYWLLPVQLHTGIPLCLETQPYSVKSLKIMHTLCSVSNSSAKTIIPMPKPYCRHWPSLGRLS